MTLYWENQAIEGSKVNGQSRHPLRTLEIVKLQGRRYHKFEARFDVTAEVIKAIDSGPSLHENSVVEVGAEVQCEKAICQSADGKPSRSVTTGSATHKTNVWKFGERTVVSIVAAHESLKNGAAKRLGVAPVASADRQLK